MRRSWTTLFVSTCLILSLASQAYAANKSIADADDRANPFEMGLGHLIDIERDDDFVGKAALKRIVADGIKRQRVGLILSAARITDNSQPHSVRLGTGSWA